MAKKYNKQALHEQLTLWLAMRRDRADKMPVATYQEKRDHEHYCHANGKINNLIFILERDNIG